MTEEEGRVKILPNFYDVICKSSFICKDQKECFSGPNVGEYGTDVYLLFYKLVFTLAPKGRKQKTFHFKMCFFKKI